MTASQTAELKKEIVEILTECPMTGEEIKVTLEENGVDYEVIRTHLILAILFEMLNDGIVKNNNADEDLQVPESDQLDYVLYVEWSIC